MARKAGRPRDGRSLKFFGKIVEEFGEFAAHQFKLSAPQDDGQPLRSHLDAYERHTGEPHPMLLDAPSLPPGGEAVWSFFIELHEARGSSGFGPLKISWRDLADWHAFTHLHLSGWQVAAIRKADDAFMADWAERNPPPKAPER